jgi:hypothetical protein
MQSSYYVLAIWDPEAAVWTSETDIPGLVIEANTLAEFESLMLELAPEMLAANESVHGKISVQFRAQAERELQVA